MDEVLVGKIKCCTKEGVYLSLGFFDDILIPPEALQHPHRFDESDQVQYSRAFSTGNHIWFQDIDLPGFSALPGFKAPFYGGGQSAPNSGNTLS